MGKKNDGSFLQQNKKLMKKIFDEWNSKYRQEMRDDVYGKICHFAETDILYYKRKDGKVKLDGNMIAKMEMESSTLHLYDNVYVQREDGEYRRPEEERGNHLQENGFRQSGKCSCTG